MLKHKLTGGYLFAGIGGFELASQWAGIEPLWSNEIDEFCCKVLKKNFNHKIIQDDIRNIKGEDLPAVDIICGGFPCQPFSIAGKRKGAEDTRWLETEMFTIIDSVCKKWCILENVGNILSEKFRTTMQSIYTNLERIEFEEPIILDFTAEAFNVPTMERHIWIIAKANRKRRERIGQGQVQRECEMQGQFSGSNQRIRRGWDISKTKFCRVGERVARKLDKTGRRRLKALGNAIPPQVAYQILQAIVEIESLKESN